MFDLERAALTRSDAWTAFFVQAVTDYVVWGARPTGRLSEEQAEWLIARVDETRTPASFAILVNVLDETTQVPAWFEAAVRARAIAGWPGLSRGEDAFSTPLPGLLPSLVRLVCLRTTKRIDEDDDDQSHPADQDIAHADAALALTCLRLIDACRSFAHVSTSLPAAGNGHQDGKFLPEARGATPCCERAVGSRCRMTRGKSGLHRRSA